jgi:hypothetical protein
MSAITLLLKEVKGLKETTQELKQETVNLKNEQVMLREQFSTFLSSQAAPHQQPSYPSSSSSSSSSSSASSPPYSVISTPGAAASGHFSPPFGNIPPASGHQQRPRGTVQPAVPFFKGMPYIAVEGIQYVTLHLRYRQQFSSDWGRLCRHGAEFSTIASSSTIAVSRHS